MKIAVTNNHEYAIVSSAFRYSNLREFKNVVAAVRRRSSYQLWRESDRLLCRINVLVLANTFKKSFGLSILRNALLSYLSISNTYMSVSRFRVISVV